MAKQEKKLTLIPDGPPTWIEEPQFPPDMVEAHKQAHRAAESSTKEEPPDSEMIGADPLLEYNPILDIWEPTDTEEQLQRFRDAGVARFTWRGHASMTGMCAVCSPNDGVTREVGKPFPSGHRLPQAHGKCQCTVEPESTPAGNEAMHRIPEEA